MTVKIPFVDLNWQHNLLQKEIERAIAEVMERGDFILGQAVREFEADFAEACGVQYAVGVASGTDAIALGLKACGVKEGDEVIVPANTFIATVIGVIKAGAKPVLADCDLSTALIDLEAAARVVTKKTKAIIPVHLYGQMVSPKQLLDFALTHNLIIFEDAAQAHLADREGYTAGMIGKAAAFSFYPSKNLGAFGNGGMLVTSDEEVANKMRTLRNYGAPKKYFHTELGTNSRLDSIQAAILKVKLPFLKNWNQLRNAVAAQYIESLQPLEREGITILENQSDKGHVYHLYVIRIAESCLLDRNQIVQKLDELGIQTGIHYPIPCHLQPAYQYLGYQLGDFPHAEVLANQILSLPMFPGLSHNQVKLVCEYLEKSINS
jgi:dTDP-4-amino-4,6-dideoxygalactose transaminase